MDDCESVAFAPYWIAGEPGIAITAIEPAEIILVDTA